MCVCAAKADDPSPVYRVRGGVVHGFSLSVCCSGELQVQLGLLVLRRVLDPFSMWVCLNISSFGSYMSNECEIRFRQRNLIRSTQTTNTPGARATQAGEGATGARGKHHNVRGPAQPPRHGDDALSTAPRSMAARANRASRLARRLASRSSPPPPRPWITATAPRPRPSAAAAPAVPVYTVVG